MHTVHTIKTFALICQFLISIGKVYCAVPNEDIESLFLAHPPDVLLLGTGERLPLFNPVRQYLDATKTSDSQLAVSIIGYVEMKIAGNDHVSAMQALSLLSFCNETNTVPYLFHSLSNKAYEPIKKTIMYVIGRKVNVNEIEQLDALLKSPEIGEEDRKRLYEGLITRMEREVTTALPFNSFPNEAWYVILFKALNTDAEMSLRMEIDSGFDRVLKGWRTSDERLSLLQSWQSDPHISQESLRLLNRRIDSATDARKTGDDRVACEWKPRKLSTEDLDKMKRDAEALRAAPPPSSPYEGPLIVDMDEEK